jgi:hypothetical protein
MPKIARVAALLLLLVAGPVRATVRVLMVGIDQYQFSVDAHDPTADPKFHNLKGAVNDLGTLRATLVTTAHLGIVPVTSGCRAVGPTSVVLTNACAGRTAIIAGWARLAAASVRGDTILFYFSGHGSTVIDATRTQESGSSDTLVPYDARGHDRNPEIIDLELKALIDVATAHGVNVVTIFDSCNSGTATRAFTTDIARAIPRGPAMRLPKFAVVAPGAHPGYRVHLSAAADGQTAVERNGHGLFTGAVAAAIADDPTATYGDLLTKVKAKLAAEPQTPGAEGALIARFLGPPPPPGRYFAGRIDGGAVVVRFGTLSFVTPGSRFEIFASSTAAARPGAKPIAVGIVTAADTHQARIVPTTPLPVASGDVFVAERAHDYGSDTIRIALDGSAVQQAAVAAALKPLPVTAVTTGAAFVAHWSGPRLQLVTTTSPPAIIYDSQVAPATMTDLTTAVRRIADYRALLALQQAAGEPTTRLRFFVGTCKSPTDPIVTAPMVAGEPTLPLGRSSYVMVSNRSEKTLYSYLFGLNHDFSVTSLNPKGAHKPIDPYPANPRCQDLDAGPGRATLLAVLSEEQLDADALAQNGRERAFGNCAKGTTAYLLCQARKHSRAFGADDKYWTVALSTTNVVEAKP